MSAAPVEMAAPVDVIGVPVPVDHRPAWRVTINGKRYTYRPLYRDLLVSWSWSGRLVRALIARDEMHALAMVSEYSNLDYADVRRMVCRGRRA